MKSIIKAKDFQHAAARMQVAGMRYRPENDAGSPMKREHQLERCVTPDLICTDGQIVFAVDVSNENIDKIPTNDSPNFEVCWREDALVDDGEGNMVQAEKPTFEVDVFDEFGVKVGTRQQLAGAIV